jgi:probable HAF family extracellular repeat protein
MIRKLLTSIFFGVAGLILIKAQTDSSSTPKQAATLSFDVVDLGTLGGNSSTAATMSAKGGSSFAGMIVGSSTAADNTSHAFLFNNGQMLDLNTLCDLSKSDFAVLTAATSIDNDGRIVGEGVTLNQQRHAFLLIPAPIDGGQWSHDCCQWIWKQIDTQANAPVGAAAVETGWWWESESRNYKWHGRPGKHPPCPPNPPHCWSWPLPCPPDTGCQPYPPRKCWCCFHEDFTGRAVVAQMDQADCQNHHGQCYQTEQEAHKHCDTTSTTVPIPATPTPTPTSPATPTPTPSTTFTPFFPNTPRLHGAQCWCCAKGVVTYEDELTCHFKHGQCYETKKSADNACHCYCCFNAGTRGHSIETVSRQDCEKRGGLCFATLESAFDDCGRCHECGPNHTIIEKTGFQCTDDSASGIRIFYDDEDFATACESNSSQPFQSDASHHRHTSGSSPTPTSQVTPPILPNPNAPRWPQSVPTPRPHSTSTPHRPRGTSTPSPNTAGTPPATSSRHRPPIRRHFPTPTPPVIR